MSNTFRGLFNSAPVITGDEIIGEDFDTTLLGDTTSGIWSSQGVKLKSIFPILKQRYNDSQQMANEFHGFTPETIVDTKSLSDIRKSVSLDSSLGGWLLSADGKRIAARSVPGTARTMSGVAQTVGTANEQYMFAFVARQTNTGNSSMAFDYGDGAAGVAGAGMLMSPGPTNYFTIDASNYITYPGLTTMNASTTSIGQDICILYTVDMSTGAVAGHKYGYATIDGAEDAAATLVTMPAPTSTAIARQYVPTLLTIQEMHGLYFWKLTTDALPSAAECRAGAEWMAKNPAEGPYLGFAAWI